MVDRIVNFREETGAEIQGRRVRGDTGSRCSDRTMWRFGARVGTPMAALLIVTDCIAFQAPHASLNRPPSSSSCPGSAPRLALPQTRHRPAGPFGWPEPGLRRLERRTPQLAASSKFADENPDIDKYPDLEELEEWGGKEELARVRAGGTKRPKMPKTSLGKASVRCPPIGCGGGWGNTCARRRIFPWDSTTHT